MNQLRPGTPIMISDIAVIPVEKVSLESHETKTGFWFLASKEPVALVIRYPYGTKAVDIDGRELKLNELVDTVPDLQAVLERKDWE
jgi:uncharacterized spore protein YtfJ